MEKITNILSRKEHHFHTITPACTLSDALSKMNCENVDYLVVLDDEDRFMGVLSEHDVASRFMTEKKPLQKIAVKDVMNSRLPMATTADTVEGCMRLMRQFNVRYIPVFDDFNFMGIVSADDIMQEAVRNRSEIFDTDISGPSGATLYYA